MKTNIQPMTIGKAIRELRQARKATLEEIAFAADTNASNLSRIERGKQGYSAETLERIAAALGITVSELHLRGESGPAPGAKARGRTNAGVLAANRYAALTPENRELANDFMALLLRRQRVPKR